MTASIPRFHLHIKFPFHMFKKVYVKLCRLTMTNKFSRIYDLFLFGPGTARTYARFLSDFILNSVLVLEYFIVLRRTCYSFIRYKNKFDLIQLSHYKLNTMTMTLFDLLLLVQIF